MNQNEPVDPFLVLSWKENLQQSECTKIPFTAGVLHFTMFIMHKEMLFLTEAAPTMTELTHEEASGETGAAAAGTWKFNPKR